MLTTLEKEQDEYEQKEASVREVIYETIGQSLFLQVKNEDTAAKVWDKLVSIMEKKGDLASMSELKEQLEGMGAPISDPSFAAMIRKSLPASYRS